MKFQTTKTLPKNTDALVVRIIGGKNTPSSGTQWLNSSAKRLISSEIKRRKFKAATGQTILLPAPAGNTFGWLIVLGIGSSYEMEAFRKTTASIIAVARANDLRVIANEAPGDKVDATDAAAATVEGALLANYKFDKYQKGPKRSVISLITLTPGVKKSRTSAIEKGVAVGKMTAEAQILARDLANEPPSIMTPRELAKRARAIARTSSLGVSVMGPAEIKRAGMGAYLAVSKGSDQLPQFIKLTYRPRKSTRNKQRHIVLVGKSITYDSGGLNLKPSRGGSLETMKMDMSGGAAVLGAMSALKKLNVKHRVTAYLPATENMLGDGAYKPGDILKTYNGKTIEVGNTDAEGRLTLADALAYATAKDKPDEIIDLATLTATDVSLGPDYAAIFATKPRTEARFKESGERSGELVWPLPFPDHYDEMTKSPVADFSNIVSGRAYTLSGPLLLRHFVDKSKSWVHLDIGGPAISESDRGYTKKGGSGFGTRLLLDYLTRN